MSSQTDSTFTHLPLKNKLAIVTGSSRGIGAAVAYDLAKRGANVILTYTSPSSLPLIQSVQTKIDSLPSPPSSTIIRADLSDPSGPATIVQHALGFLKHPDIQSKHIDILINNAGLTLTKSLSQTTHADFSSLYDLNVRGTFFLTQAVLAYLPPTNGRIINISSVGARAGFANMSVYCSSKAAIEGLTRSWAGELGGNGTTVNCVNPGPIETEMMVLVSEEIRRAQVEATPLGKRMGREGDIVGVVGFLAGEDSSWVTGQTISASGGWAMY